MSICGQTISANHEIILIGIAIGYYWFTFQLVRLFIRKKGIFEDFKVRAVALILAVVFILCGNSKWMGCSGNIVNDFILLIFQYIMIIIIELRFNSNVYSDTQIKEAVSSEIDKELIDKIFMDDDLKEWFFHQGLHGAVNNKGYFILLSDKWTEVLGWQKSELLSRPFIEFVHPDDRQKTLKTYNEGDKKDYKEFVNRYQHKAGHYVALNWPNETMVVGENFTFKAEVLK